MGRLLPFLVLALQLFCFYQAYKRGAKFYWYLLIFFFPLIGCLLFLYVHFYSRENLDRFTEGLQDATNGERSTDKLEKDLAFSDTIEKRTKLAEKYMEKRRYKEAIELFESCLEGFNKNDTGVRRRLVLANYLYRDHERAIHYAEELKGDRNFNDSEEKIAYAWALFEVGRKDEATHTFEEMNTRYSNYPHRMEYARYLDIVGKNLESIRLLEELMAEYEQMEPYERRLKKQVMRDIKSLHKRIRTRS